MLNTKIDNKFLIISAFIAMWPTLGTFILLSIIGYALNASGLNGNWLHEIKIYIAIFQYLLFVVLIAAKFTLLKRF